MWLHHLTHRSGSARWPVTLALVSAAMLGLGAAAGSPASAATAGWAGGVSGQAAPASAGSAGEAAGPAGSPGAASSPGSSHGTACVKRPSGKVTDCPKPLSKSQLPAGAKNSAIVSQTPANLAALVDTLAR